MNWNDKKRLTKDEVYGQENIFDDYIYFDDYTAIKIFKDKVEYYKLLNPYTINISIYKYIKQLHREDGPAIEYANGDKFWFKEDKLHREDGPAIEYANGDKFWYKEGKLHREDGPAKEYADGDKFWYKEGKYHRVNLFIRLTNLFFKRK